LHEHVGLAHTHPHYPEIHHRHPHIREAGENL
jgi:hypothetical protein